MKPGKKGISLSPEDWAQLAGHMGAVDAALGRRDMAYALNLTKK